MTSPPEYLQSVVDSLRPSPRGDRRFRVRSFGDDSDQPVLFYVYVDVLEELAFASGYDEGPICVALLLGGFGVEENRGFVEISGFTALSYIHDWDELYPTIREACDEWFRSGSDDVMVGLFVGCDGCQARVDPEMARVHFSLFNVPFQPLVVCDASAGMVSINARAPGTAFFNVVFRAVDSGAANQATAPLNPPDVPSTPDADD